MSYKIKNKLKQVRLEKGFSSMRQFSKEIEIRRDTLMSLEKNDSNITLINVLRICKLLDCKFEELFELTGSLEKKKVVKVYKKRGRKPFPLDQLNPIYRKRKLRELQKLKEKMEGEELEKNNHINE